MNLTSDTPAKGDYAAYVKRLTEEADAAALAAAPLEMVQGRAGAPGAAPAAPAPVDAAPAAPAPDAPAPAGETPAAPGSTAPAAPAAPAPAPAPPKPSLKDKLPDITVALPYLQHFWRLVVAWFACRGLGTLVPGGSFVFVFVLLGYVCWVMFKIDLYASNDLVKRMSAMAQDILAKALKAPSLPPKPVPKPEKKKAS
jgi:hypothetical protein